MTQWTPVWEVEFAKRTNIQIDKNHINGITTRGKIIMTPHGFINDTDKEIKSYKDDHAAEWSKILGGMDFDIYEEEDVLERRYNINNIKTIHRKSYC